VKILKSSDMDGSHVKESGTNKDSNTFRMKYQLISLEKKIEQMKNTIYEEGEKVERLEAEMSRLLHEFNEDVRGSHANVNMITNTLIDDVQDKLKTI
jgi:hypothetical protein